MLQDAASNQSIDKRIFGIFGWPLLLPFVFACWVTPTFADDPQKIGANSAATTFVVVRHAEREGNKDQLSVDGVARAEALRSLGKLLNVSVIYSTDTQRTKNTAKPLADDLGLELKLYRQVTRRWIDSLKQQHAGQVVLIVGHSNTAGGIAGLLASAESYPIEHDEYDALFIVSVTESSSHSVRLRYGKSSKGAPSADKMGDPIIAKPPR